MDKQKKAPTLCGLPAKPAMTMLECKPPVDHPVQGIHYCGICGKEMKPEDYWWVPENYSHD